MFSTVNWKAAKQLYKKGLWMYVSKYSSSLAMQVESGRYPIITHRAWGSLMKYWPRLGKFSANVLLNNAYKTVCTEDHPWMQCSIFAEIEWFWRPLPPERRFYMNFTGSSLMASMYNLKASNGKIREANMFTVPHNLKDTFGKSKYIDVIKNADICLIFTRLKTDLTVLKTCMINTDISKNCPYGCNEQETVVHLLSRCRKFDEARSEFVSLCEIPRHKIVERALHVEM